jgi:hypothetical protein
MGRLPTADGGRSGIDQVRNTIRAEGRRLRSPPAVLRYARWRIPVRHHFTRGRAIGHGAGLSGVFRPRMTADMQDFESGLRRISLPRTSVNKLTHTP